jgi:hypothetical protein
MDIPLNKLAYSFKTKPLLIGGKAMEYYDLRHSGDDIDLIATEEDIVNLIEIYPARVKDLWGDLGVCPLEFEIWKTIRLFDYDFYSENSIETEDYLIISLEKLLFMKTLAIEEAKYLDDVKLITHKLASNQRELYKKIAAQNKHILERIENLIYLEKEEPQS